MDHANKVDIHMFRPNSHSEWAPEVLFHFFMAVRARHLTQ